MKKYIFLSLTVLCIIFIYFNSLMNGDISTAQSSFVLRLALETLEAIGVPPDLITGHMVRKLAHFSEYALLGFLVINTVTAWFDKWEPHLFMILFTGLFVPTSDEFLQLFVAGRTGLVQDIVLDFSGFLTGAAFYILLVVLSKYKWAVRRQK